MLGVDETNLSVDSAERVATKWCRGDACGQPRQASEWGATVGPCLLQLNLIFGEQVPTAIDLGDDDAVDTALQAAFPAGDDDDLAGVLRQIVSRQILNDDPALVWPEDQRWAPASSSTMGDLLQRPVLEAHAHS